MTKKPNPMLLDYHGRHYCLNCDWLSFSAKINPNASVTPRDGYRIEKLTGTNVFKERFILYDKTGSKVMTACCNPYSSAIPDTIASLQVANAWLYNADGNRLNDLIGCFKDASFNGLSRLDICLDFNPTESEFGTIRKLASGAQYVGGKSEGAIWWHEEHYNGKSFRMPHCLNWGSPKSVVKWKLYNKSLEIDAAHPERCLKPWILDEWACHLEDTTKVWRLEVSITDVNQLAFCNQRLSFMSAFDSQMLAFIFSTLKGKSFVVRKNQGKRNGHKNEDQRVPFVPFVFDAIEIRKANPMSEREPLDEMRQLARNLVLHLTDTHVLLDTFRYQSIRELLFDMASNAQVMAYLDWMCDGSFSNFIAEADAMVGEGFIDRSEESPEVSNS